MRYAVIAALLLGATFGGSLVLAREPDTAAKVEAQDLFLKEFAGDPSKEVRSHLYTFPPGAILPWHEIAYVIEGTFTFERAGEAPKVMRAGDVDYVAPNIVHRGMNLSDAPVKLFVMRIKDAPLVQEVPAPKQ